MESIDMENTLSLNSEVGYQLPREIILRAIGYQNPDSAGEEINDLITEYLGLAIIAADPKAIYRSTSFRLVGDDQVELLDGQILTSEMLYQTIAECEGIIIGLVTLGSKTDAAIAAVSQEDAFCGYLTDVISSLLVEILAHKFWQYLVSELGSQGYRATSFVSPGAIKFPLPEQKRIFQFLQPERIGVTLTESCLMEPSKSLTVILGYGKQIEPAKYSHDCSTCDMKDCLIRGIHIDLAESNAGY
ncbi:MAG TPA: hypothetical protein GX739_01410 [Firmicutes bacterium]|nr:hypothetical protein [Bacillota bacterium]